MGRLLWLPILLLASTTFISPCASSDTDVVTLSSDNFKSSVQDGLWLVEFFAPWCGHCQQLAPIFKQGAAALKGKLNFAAVDAEANDDLRVEFGVSSFPSLKLFKSGELREDFDGDRTVAGFEQYYEKVKDLGAKPSSVVQVLTTENFDTKINVPLALVKFYAPWCGHCKALAPTWEQLAAKLHPDVMVAKVDVTSEQALQSRFNVGGFPSIHLFKQGRARGVHQGARTIADITEWVAKISSTSVSTLEGAGLDQLLASSKAPPTFVLLGGTDADVELFSAAAEINFREQQVAFAAIDLSKVSDAAREKLPRSSNSAAVVLVVNSGEVTAMDRSADLKSALPAFIDANKAPYFYSSVVPGENFNEVMYSDTFSAVIHVSDNTDPVAQEYLATFKKVAMAMRGQFVFGAIDAKKHADLSGQVGMFPSVLPQLCVFDGKNLKYYADQQLGRSAADITSFLEKVLAGGATAKTPGDEKESAAKASPPAAKRQDKLYDADAGGAEDGGKSTQSRLDKHEKILEEMMKSQRKVQEAILQIRDEIIDLRRDMELVLE